MAGYGHCFGCTDYSYDYGNKTQTKKDEPQIHAVTVDESIQSCSLAKKRVAEHGLNVGVPDGWKYELQNGTITIKKDKETKKAL